MEKKTLYLNVAIFIISALIGAGTILAVKADLGKIGECISSSIYYFDADGDGYGDPANSTEACPMPEGYVENSEDCNDSDDAINPDADELCDGVDNNCSGTIDDGEGMATSTFYFDADGDGYGITSPTILACAAPLHYASTSNDCDDANAGIYPGASEICDGLDNNCNSQTDEDLATSTYYIDEDGDGYGVNATTTVWCSLPEGFSENDADCDDNSAVCHPGAAELCDGLDNDCDGTVDENCNSMQNWYRDADGDGHGNAGSTVKAKTRPAGYVANSSDCNDADAAIHPDASELCDGIDNDCDGQIDEGLVFSTYYFDADNDSYGFTATTTYACAAPDGFVANSSDCDDDDSAIHPGAVEICDDGIDNNCSGEADEGCGTYYIYYRDADGDGYGNAGLTVKAKTRPAGYVANSSDCDDADAAIHPDAVEICGDEIDNDCDGQTDENCASSTRYYRDADGDGYGDPDKSVLAVSQPSGYVSNNDDCDDIDTDIHPGANEICDDIDNDCDGIIDEGCEDSNECECECSCKCVCTCKNSNSSCACNCSDNDDDNEEHGCGSPSDYKNHGQYVGCWAHWTNWLKSQGKTSGQEKGRIMSQKAQNKGNDCLAAQNCGDDDDDDDDDDGEDDKIKNNNKNKTKNKGNKNK